MVTEFVSLRGPDDALVSDNQFEMVPKQRGTANLKPGHAIGWITVLIVGSGIVVFLLPYIMFLGFGDTKENVTDDWPQFYEQTVSNHFWIPAEAKIRYAERREEVFMGGGFLVVFTLPESREPKHWLETMAQRSKIYPYRKSKFKFDAGGDINRLEYFPDRGEFEAEFMWD